MMSNLSLSLSLSPSRLPAGIGAQKVRVEEELEAYPTESVDLRCQFIDGGGRTKLTQVGTTEGNNREAQNVKAVDVVVKPNGAISREGDNWRAPRSRSSISPT